MCWYLINIQNLHLHLHQPSVISDMTFFDENHVHVINIEKVIKALLVS